MLVTGLPCHSGTTPSFAHPIKSSVRVESAAQSQGYGDPALTAEINRAMLGGTQAPIAGLLVEEMPRRGSDRNQQANLPCRAMAKGVSTSGPVAELLDQGIDPPCWIGRPAGLTTMAPVKSLTFTDDANGGQRPEILLRLTSPCCVMGPVFCRAGHSGNKSPSSWRSKVRRSTGSAHMDPVGCCPTASSGGEHSSRWFGARATRVARRSPRWCVV